MPDKVVSPKPISFNIGTLSISVENVEVIPADGVEVEDSKEPRFLRLQIGDVLCFNRVFLRIDGDKHEITRDTLPPSESCPEGLTAMDAYYARSESAPLP